MDVHDDEQDHLITILNGEDDNVVNRKSPDFVSPTEQHILSRKQYKEALNNQWNEHRRKHARLTVSQETNESKERYEHLPDYARASFVPAQGRLPLGSSKLPSGVIVNYPSDPRLMEILKRTAVKAVSTPQIEIMIKVKQSNNRDFDFLLSDHQWHSYYLHLKDLEDKKQNQTGVGLLEMYSSSEEDDEVEEDTIDESGELEEPHAVRLIHPEKPDATADRRIIEMDEAARKAKRLKRARMMKGHYALKLMESNSKAEC